MEKPDTKQGGQAIIAIDHGFGNAIGLFVKIELSAWLLYHPQGKILTKDRRQIFVHPNDGEKSGSMLSYRLPRSKIDAR
jgi:hypothetical protein